MVSLPAFPPDNGHMTDLPRRHRPDAESNIPKLNVYQTYACIQKACLDLFMIGLLHQFSPMIRTLSIPSDLA